MSPEFPREKKKQLRFHPHVIFPARLVEPTAKLARPPRPLGERGGRAAWLAGCGDRIEPASVTPGFVLASSWAGLGGGGRTRVALALHGGIRGAGQGERKAKENNKPASSGTRWH